MLITSNSSGAPLCLIVEEIFYDNSSRVFDTQLCMGHDTTEFHKISILKKRFHKFYALFYVDSSSVKSNKSMYADVCVLTAYYTTTDSDVKRGHNPDSIINILTTWRPRMRYRHEAKTSHGPDHIHSKKTDDFRSLDGKGHGESQGTNGLTPTRQVVSHPKFITKWSTSDITEKIKAEKEDTKKIKKPILANRHSPNPSSRKKPVTVTTKYKKLFTSNIAEETYQETNSHKYLCKIGRNRILIVEDSNWTLAGTLFLYKEMQRKNFGRNFNRRRENGRRPSSFVKLPSFRNNLVEALIGKEQLGEFSDEDTATEKLVLSIEGAFSEILTDAKKTEEDYASSFAKLRDSGRDCTFKGGSCWSEEMQAAFFNSRTNCNNLVHYKTYCKRIKKIYKTKNKEDTVKPKKNKEDAIKPKTRKIKKIRDEAESRSVTRTKRLRHTKYPQLNTQDLQNILPKKSQYSYCNLLADNCELNIGHFVENETFEESNIVDSRKYIFSQTLQNVLFCSYQSCFSGTVSLPIDNCGNLCRTTAIYNSTSKICCIFLAQKRMWYLFQDIPCFSRIGYRILIGRVWIGNVSRLFGRGALETQYLTGVLDYWKFSFPIIYKNSRDVLSNQSLKVYFCSPTLKVPNVANDPKLLNYNLRLLAIQLDHSTNSPFARYLPIKLDYTIDRSRLKRAKNLSSLNQPSAEKSNNSAMHIQRFQKFVQNLTTVNKDEGPDNSSIIQEDLLAKLPSERLQKSLSTHARLFAIVVNTDYLVLCTSLVVVDDEDVRLGAAFPYPTRTEGQIVTLLGPDEPFLRRGRVVLFSKNASRFRNANSFFSATLPIFRLIDVSSLALLLFDVFLFVGFGSKNFGGNTAGQLSQHNTGMLHILIENLLSLVGGENVAEMTVYSIPELKD
ncbi:hypothetical protein WN51_06150 [Melipona quadrifasciata]|uniref:Uncharacterized protein n=1 Tax=Melipona quadrifasciata TaxID=166423 RepID=A0A0M8ZR33_9HYME|nr:hypothetical protein WN51_06150 [Melipona quadrifasciata]